MKPIADPRLKTDETDGPVERGLAQAQGRDAMISVEQLLADFKLER
ncbi:MAG: hypothetical protein ACKVOS_00760 [Sphingorhabdus sp.]